VPRDSFVWPTGGRVGFEPNRRRSAAVGGSNLRGPVLRCVHWPVQARQVYVNQRSDWRSGSPVGFTPVTAVPTVIRFGNRRRARVQVEDGSWQEVNVSDLDQYVSEEFNPENTKRVRGVEVFLSSSLLAGGMCFVDTPGLGSIFTGNTAATQAFIPHIDAALS